MIDPRPSPAPRALSTRSRRRARGWIRTPVVRVRPAHTPAKTILNPLVCALTIAGRTTKATAGAPNTHGASGTTTVRNRRCFTAGPRTRHGLRAGVGRAVSTVSGVLPAPGRTTAMSARWGRYDTMRGAVDH